MNVQLSLFFSHFFIFILLHFLLNSLIFIIVPSVKALIHQEAMKMREKMQRFMYGRYGMDRLNQILMCCAFLCLILSFFGSGVCYIFATAAMFYAYFRMFSRNIGQRSLENNWYLKQEMKFKGFMGKRRNSLEERKKYHIYKCPNCKQKLRVPRGRGKIAISCKKCGNEFIKRS